MHLLLKGIQGRESFDKKEGLVKEQLQAKAVVKV